MKNTRKQYKITENIDPQQNCFLYIYIILVPQCGKLVIDSLVISLDIYATHNFKVEYVVAMFFAETFAFCAFIFFNTKINWNLLALIHMQDFEV